MPQCCCQDLFRSQDQDLGLQVSRPRPRPGQNELECTQVSKPWSQNHITGCINSNWRQSTRLKVLQITIIMLQARHQACCLETKTYSRSQDQDQDLGHQVSRPRYGSSGLETKTETLAIRSRDLNKNELECTRVSKPWSRDHNTVVP